MLVYQYTKSVHIVLSTCIVHDMQAWPRVPDPRGGQVGGQFFVTKCGKTGFCLNLTKLTLI